MTEAVPVSEGSPENNGAMLAHMQMTDRKGRHRMKTGKLKKKVLPVVIIYLILLPMAAVSCGRPGSKKNKLPEEDVTVISGADLKKVVNADGTVRCADPHYIYSAQALPVKNVLVKEGDKVTPETVLCQLDTTALEAKAAQQEAALEKAEKSANQSVAAAKHRLDSQVEGINNGTDSVLVDSANKVILAKEAYEKAQKAYKDAQTGRDQGLDGGIYETDKAVESARQQLEFAEKYYDDIKDDKMFSDLSKEAAKNEVDACRLALDQASKTRQIALRESDISLADLAVSEDDAYQAYLTAILAQYAVGRNVYNNAVSESDALSTARIQTDMTADELVLEELLQNIEDARVKAGCTGVVTAVNVDSGSLAGNGTLFVVEDTSDLEVAADVKEYDINSVKKGQSVSITSESAAGKEYHGTVTYTAPAANKDEDSHTDLDADAKYRVLVSVDDPDGELLIGMSVRLEITESGDMKSIDLPEEAVYTDEKGQSHVLILAGEGPGYTVTEADVSAGKSRDGRITVSGDVIKEGAIIINDAGRYRVDVGRSVQM